MASKRRKPHSPVISITPAEKISKTTRKFGDLLERPPESNSKLKERSSIPCGPDKKDRISSFLVDNGFKINRAEILFSLLRRLCSQDDGRPIEADERHVWLGSNPIGIVMSFMEKPTLHIWMDQLLTTSYRNGSMNEVEKDIQHILNNTRALSALVNAFEIPYELLVPAIAENRFAALVADTKSTCLRFYDERASHPTRVFQVEKTP